MKMLTSVVLFGLIGLFGLLNGEANAQVDDFTTAAALVKKQSPQDWSQLQAALTAVVSKKSGLSENKLAADNAIDVDFKSVVMRNYYEQLPPEADFSGLWFHVVVDAARLNTLLIDKNIPLWPESRPNVFVWLVEEHADGSLVHADKSSLSRYWLQKWLDNKAINNQFYDPLEADLLQFEPSDVSYLKPELINQVFNDYQPDYVLLVKVRDNGNGYTYRFGLSADPEVEPIVENRQFVALSSGLKYLSASIQGHLSGGQQIDADEFGDYTMAVTINGINDAAGMLRLWNYLQSHPLLSNVRASEYKQHSLQLRFESKVTAKALVRVLDQEKLLQHQPLGYDNQWLFTLLP